MKKIFLSATAVSLTLVSYNLAVAQANTDMTYTSRVIQTASTYKTENPGRERNLGNTVPVTKNEIGTKVARSFLQTFKNITSVYWFKVNKNLFLAHFELEGRRSKALFQKNGGIVYIISTGQEKSLPKDVRWQIKSLYIDYSIGIVNEIYSNNQKVCVVNLEDKENLIVVTITNGDLQQLSQFKLAP